MTQQNRRSFLSKLGLSAAALSLGLISKAEDRQFSDTRKRKSKKEIFKGGLAVSTWNAGIPANEAAIKAMLNGGNAVDMAEQGVRLIEGELTHSTVGLSGFPDRDGFTTLDACIMAPSGRAGSVCFLEKIKHPVTVARWVMERTPHVMLVGEGAQKFALEQGMELLDFKSEDAVKAYKEWLIKSEYKPVINIENHDTIGMVTQDSKGDIAGSCTTSGLAFKMRGRVGDSPIIGSGLYVDNLVGAATGSGLGETVLRACSAFLIVELMRNGAHPSEACEEAVKRVEKINSFMTDDFQVGFIAINKYGEHGAFSRYRGFNYAAHQNGKNILIDSEYLLK